MKTLKDLRNDLGWTQLELSLKAKIGYSTYTKLEVGRSDASSETIQKLAKFYQISRKRVVSALRASQDAASND